MSPTERYGEIKLSDVGLVVFPRQCASLAAVEYDIHIFCVCVVFFLPPCALRVSPMTSFISDWLWSERFWFPENVTWADLESPPPGVDYPRLRHLQSAVPLAVALFVLRVLFER